MPTSSGGSPRRSPPSTPTRPCPAGSNRRRRSDREARSLDGGVVAYFSPEFGIAEALPQYSGGLGVLAGDHLKAASDLGVPLVAIGLYYRHGYFRQSLSVDGWQQERFPDLDPHAQAIELCDGIRIELELAGETLRAQVWKATVGRTPLYLLDTDLPENPTELQLVTDRLYGGDVEHRLRQEILLGIGGVRALEALGIPVRVFHTNEGHAGFLGLERIRNLMSGDGLSFAEARRGGARRVGVHHPHARAGRHRPVPPGDDRALLRRLGLGVRSVARRPHGPRPPSRRRARRPVQHGGHGHAPRRTTQRGVGAARRGEPRDVRRPLAGGPRGRDPGGPHHQRRARRDLGVRRDRRDPVGRPSAATGSGAIPSRGEAAHRHRRRRALGGPAAGQGPHDRPGPGAPDPGRHRPGPLGLGDGVGRPTRSTRGRSRSASPAAWPPTSGPRSCSARRSGCDGCSPTTSDRSSSCSPARPTRPTTTARSSSARSSTFSHDADGPLTGSCSSRTTTWPSPAPWSRVPTSG